MEPSQANSDNDMKNNSDDDMNSYSDEEEEEELDAAELGRKYLKKYHDALIIWNDIVAECPNNILTHEHISIHVKWQIHPYKNQAKNAPWTYIEYIKDKISKHDNIREMMLLPITVQIKQAMMFAQEKLPRNKKEKKYWVVDEFTELVRTSAWTRLTDSEKDRALMEFFHEYGEMINDQ